MPAFFMGMLFLRTKEVVNEKRSVLSSQRKMGELGL